MANKTPEQLKAELLKAKLKAAKERGLRAKGTGTGGDLVSGLTEFGRGVNRALLRSVGVGPRGEVGPLEIPLPTNVFSKTHPMGLGKRENDQFAARIGEEVGANLPFMGAAQKAAPIVSQLAETGANVVQRAFGTLAKGITKTPGKATIGETVATVGSGTGAAVAEQEAPGNRLAEMGGQLAGGFALPAVFMMAPKMLMNNVFTRIATKYGKQAFSAVAGELDSAAAAKVQQAIGTVPVIGPRAAEPFGKAVERATQMAARSARENVRKELVALAGKDYQPNIVAAQQLEDAVPGLDLSIGQRTQSPFVLMRQLDIQKYMTPAEVMALHTRYNNNQAMLDKFIWTKRPQSDLSPDYIINTVNGRINSERLQTEELVKLTSGQQQALAKELPEADLAQIGANLRQLQIKYRAKTQAELAEMRESLGLNNVDLKTPFNDWRNAMLQKYRGRTYSESNMDDVLNTIENIGKPNVAERMAAKETDTPRVITWDDLEYMDQILGDAYRSARSGNSPNFAKARAIAEMQRDVTSFMDGLDSTLGANYTQYKQAYREKLIEPFRDKAAFETTARNERGFYRTYDEDVAANYFKAGGISDIRQFKKVYGDDPQANRALEAVVLDNLRMGATSDGVTSPRKFQNWLTQHDSVLREVPAIRDRVLNVQRANEALVERQSYLQARLQEINDQKLSKIVKSVTNLQTTPEGGIAMMLRDPRLMKQAWEKLDDQGKEAMRRHVWDSVIDQDADKVQDFIRQNAKALRIIYDNKGLMNLVTLADAKHIIDLIPKPSLPKMEFSPSADVERAIGMSLPVLGSRIQALNTGRASKTWIITDALGRFVRGHSERDIINAWKAAIFDDKLAEEIVEYSVKPTREMAKRLHTRFFLLGIPTEYQEQPEQETDYMRPAVPFSDHGLQKRAAPTLGGMR